MAGNLQDTIHLPDFLGDHENSEAELKSKVENVDHLDYGSVTLKGVIDEENFDVSCGSQAKQEISRQAWEENAMKGEFPVQRQCLRAEQRSLQTENAQLESEIQNLQMKLQTLPELHQECVLQLKRKSTEEEKHHLQMDGKHHSMFRDVTCT
ncbi:Cutaneous T-cell lymphoma-associated antigen 5 [Tupaia chinensis]|uniref:Cutaneous T-cell lymphoma-associated antigen 5 n=1 Tax=Tupaia chinensis TaxID=246437 RepID=L9LBT3_TUPCH|nr:Cutaneous T-cell lymphoma-associated antigen 5 [Tupaia chinensis]